MMAQQFFLVVAIGLLFAGPFCLWVIADVRQRHNAAEAYAAGYRAGQLAEFDAQAQLHVQRQSAAIQQRQAEESPRQYRAQRGALG